MAAQEEVIAFLAKGGNYGKPDLEVIRIDTHCSIIFLIGAKAYKMKRQVAFSRLDYSSLTLRERACRAEIHLNRRTAPELYLGLCCVRRRADGKLGFDGAGMDVEWLVVMRRFDQALLLGNLAAGGKLDGALAAALAGEVAAFHGKAERTAEFGGAEGLRRAIEQNRRDQESLAPLLGEVAIAMLHHAALRRLGSLAPLLDRRRAAGWVRRGHGDLRLANICLFQGRPTLFDAIEFSDEASCADILFDAAFLILDMHQHGLALAANIFFNRYLDLTGTADGLAALPLMLSIRAGTRAYTLAGAAQRGRDAAAGEKQAAAARAHMALALSLLGETSPLAMAVSGANPDFLSGLAAGSWPIPGARILAGAAGRGIGGLLREAADTAAAGYDVLLDAGSFDAASRRETADWALARKIPFVGLSVGGASAPPEEGAAGWCSVRSLPAARLVTRAVPRVLPG